MRKLKSVLILISNEEMREAVCERFIENMELKVLTAKDGVIARGKVVRQKFDLIILDDKVKKKTPFDLIADIREAKYNELTPIIIYSDDIEKLKLRTRAVKNIEYRVSPIDPKKLIERSIYWLSKKIDHKSFVVDVDFINPFIESAIEILMTKYETQEVKNEGVELLKYKDKLDIDISETLKISSPYFKGIISISYPSNVYKKLTPKTDGEKSNESSEMISKVFEKTKRQLNKKGFKLQKAKPMLIKGKGHKIQSSKAPVLLLPFNSNAGKFYIQIYIQPT